MATNRQPAVRPSTPQIAATSPRKSGRAAIKDAADEPNQVKSRSGKVATSKSVGRSSVEQDPFLSQEGEEFRAFEHAVEASLRDKVAEVAAGQRAVSEESATSKMETALRQPEATLANRGPSPSPNIRQVAERNVEQPGTTQEFDALADLFEQANRREAPASRVRRPLPPPGQPLYGSVMPFEAESATPPEYVPSERSQEMPKGQIDAGWEPVAESLEEAARDLEFGATNRSLIPENQPERSASRADSAQDVMIVDGEDVPDRIQIQSRGNDTGAEVRTMRFAIDPQMELTRQQPPRTDSAEDLFPVVSRSLANRGSNISTIDWNSNAVDSKAAMRASKVDSPELSLPSLDAEPSQMISAPAEGIATDDEPVLGLPLPPVGSVPAESTSGSMSSDALATGPGPSGPSLTGPSLAGPSLFGPTLGRGTAGSEDGASAGESISDDQKSGDEDSSVIRMASARAPEDGASEDIHLDDVDFDIEPETKTDDDLPTSFNTKTAWYAIGLACVSVVIVVVRRMRNR
ncbi:hypothetical protein [Stratiformator vulcanicus]|uniref:hypothetical protein n=1 Tax=Stratiformator vulcanicus TaxID=2527980 RepID=UPI0011A26DE3|nr:hypothetical protein [Stratiformator vulcanicus]